MQGGVVLPLWRMRVIQACPNNEVKTIVPKPSESIDCTRPQSVQRGLKDARSELDLVQKKALTGSGQRLDQHGRSGRLFKALLLQSL